MVKIGFIVEGRCDKAVLNSPAFRKIVAGLSLWITGDIENAKGKNNLSGEKGDSYVNVLRDKGASHIVILRDLDELTDLEAAKQEVIRAGDISLCVAIRELEAWFLANSGTLSAIFKTNFYCEHPEQESNPKETLKILSQRFRNGRGIDDEVKFTNLMLANGFSIERAAAHPNCPSARYFLTKLQTIASATF